MNLKIRGVFGEKLDNERIVIDVLENSVPKENYILFDTTYDDKGKISNKHRHPFFFCTNQVNKGEVIVIYTKQGDDYISKSSKQTKMYVLHWGLGVCVWNNNKDNALLAHVTEYVGKIV